MADLGDLGLSEYESRVYRTLLKTGATTASELSEASGVPMGRIYDVLGSAETRGLVRSQSAGRPKKYVAVEPETALDRLLAERKRDLEARAEQYEAAVATLKDELDPAPAREDRFWTAALGPDETVDLLVERIRAADRRVVVVVSVPGSSFDLREAGHRVADALEAATDRGVAVSILGAVELVGDVPAAVYGRFTEDLAARDAFSVRTTDDVQGSFALVDESEVCIEVPNPLDGEEPFAVINLKDAAFAADARDAFERRWAEADPL